MYVVYYSTNKKDTYDIASKILSTGPFFLLTIREKLFTTRVFQRLVERDQVGLDCSLELGSRVGVQLSRQVHLSVVRIARLKRHQHAQRRVQTSEIDIRSRRPPDSPHSCQRLHCSPAARGQS